MRHKTGSGRLRRCFGIGQKSFTALTGLSDPFSSGQTPLSFSKRRDGSHFFPKSENRPPTAAGSRFHKAKRTRIGLQDPYHCACRKCNYLNISHLAIFITHEDFPPTTTDRKLSEDRQSMTVPSISDRQSSPVNRQTSGSGQAVRGLTSASSDTPRQYPSPLPADWPPPRILSEATCRQGASDHGQAY